MADRIHCLTVALDKDIREDDIPPLINAVRQLRGVAGVTALVVDSTDFAARCRVDLQWRHKLLDLLGGATDGQ